MLLLMSLSILLSILFRWHLLFLKKNSFSILTLFISFNISINSKSIFDFTLLINFTLFIDFFKLTSIDFVLFTPIDFFMLYLLILHLSIFYPPIIFLSIFHSCLQISKFLHSFRFMHILKSQWLIIYALILLKFLYFFCIFNI